MTARPTASPHAGRVGRLLDAAQSWGVEPVVNPKRGKLPGVVVTGESAWSPVVWFVLAAAVVALSIAVTVAFGDRIGGFIYANF